MRISDWSSDVCSSDLHRPGAVRHHRLHPHRNPRTKRSKPPDPRRNVLTHAEPERVTGWMMVRRGLRLVSALSRHGFGWLLERAHLGWLVPFHRGLFGYPRQPQPYTAPDHVRMALECRSEEHTSELQSLMRISYAV